MNYVSTEQITGQAIVDRQMLAAKSDRSKLAILIQVARYLEANLKVKQDPERWTIEGAAEEVPVIPDSSKFRHFSGIMNRDITSAICLLTDIAQVLGCPYTIPPNISIAVIRREVNVPGQPFAQKSMTKTIPKELPGGVKNKTSVHKVTSEEVKMAGVVRSMSGLQRTSDQTQPKVDGKYSSDLQRCMSASQSHIVPSSQEFEPDAFDKLFEHPEKMSDVTKVQVDESAQQYKLH